MSRHFWKTRPTCARPRAPRRPVDYIGFGALALWLATLQVILDRGQQDDWFNATWLCWASVISLVSMIVLHVWELRLQHPLVDLRVLAQSQFRRGHAADHGGGRGALQHHGPAAAVSARADELPGAQQRHGHQPARAGRHCRPDGRGPAGRQDRHAAADGLGFRPSWPTPPGSSATSTCEIATSSVAWPNILSGVAMGFIFVPLATTTMGDLPNEQMGNAAGMFNLMRNIGGSIGISMAATMVARGAQFHQALMVRPPHALRSAISARTPHAGCRAVAIRQSTGCSSPHLRVAGRHGNAAGRGLHYVDTFRILAVLCASACPCCWCSERFARTTARRPFIEAAAGE